MELPEPEVRWEIPDALGLTLPRIEAMTDAYRRRRAGELRDLASAVALATHDPKRIEKAIKDPGSKRDRDPNWVHETWWRRTA